MNKPPDIDLFRQLTQARVALKRSGHAMTTRDYLTLKYAHSKAANAIYSPWHVELLKEHLFAEQEKEIIIVKTQVSSREEYLQRPDLGRLLNSESICELKNHAALNQAPYDLVFIFSDGLSAEAIDSHILPLWKHIKIALHPLALRIAPVVLAPFSRVAISDEIGFYLKSKMAIIIIGERPGSSATDSLSIYTTYNPKVGNIDAQRNCISNIRPPHGLSYLSASIQLSKLLQASLQQQLSGAMLQLPTDV